MVFGKLITPNNLTLYLKKDVQIYCIITKIEHGFNHYACLVGLVKKSFEMKMKQSIQMYYEERNKKKEYGHTKYSSLTSITLIIYENENFY